MIKVRIVELEELFRKAYKAGRRNALKQDKLNFNDFISYGFAGRKQLTPVYGA